jgi:hypothetical protein
VLFKFVNKSTYSKVLFYRTGPKISVEKLCFAQASQGRGVMANTYSNDGSFFKMFGAESKVCFVLIHDAALFYAMLFEIDYDAMLFITLTFVLCNY